jgi:S-adenosylmethionine decarboxylase
MPSAFFEGPEKKVELVVVDGHRSLRSYGEDAWHTVVAAANAKVLSKRSSEVFDAYLLSESSLFVYDEHITLITCGQTSLVDAAIAVVDLVGVDAVAFLALERKNEHFPQEQPSTFREDARRLRSIVPGRALRFGDEHSHCIELFHTVRAYAPDAKDTTIEILMHGIPECARRFAGGDDGALERIRGTGVCTILPGFEIDDHVFSPAGYSLNALKDDLYYTLHVTPEEVGSYASFETNFDFREDPLGVVDAVIEIFRPESFDLFAFTPDGSQLQLDVEGYRERKTVFQKVLGYGVSFQHLYRPQGTSSKAYMLDIESGGSAPQGSSYPATQLELPRALANVRGRLIGHLERLEAFAESNESALKLSVELEKSEGEVWDELQDRLRKLAWVDEERKAAEGRNDRSRVRTKRLSKELAESAAARDEARDDIRVGEAESEALEGKLDWVGTQRDSAREALAELLERLPGLRSELVAKEASLAESRQELEREQAEADRLVTAQATAAAATGETAKTLTAIQERVARLRSEVTNSEAALGEAATDLQTAQSDLEGLSAESERVKAELEAAQAMGAEVERDLLERSRLRDGAFEELSTAQRAVSAAKARHESLEAELNRTKTLLPLAREEAVALEAHIEHLEAERDDLCERSVTVHASYEAARKALAPLQEKVSVLRRENAEVECELGAAQSELEGFEGESKTLDEARQLALRELERKRQELGDCRAGLASLNAALEEAEGASALTGADVSAAKTARRELDERLEATRAQLVEAKAALAGHTERSEVLSRDVERAEAELASVRDDASETEGSIKRLTAEGQALEEQCTEEKSAARIGVEALSSLRERVAVRVAEHQVARESLAEVEEKLARARGDLKSVSEAHGTAAEELATLRVEAVQLREESRKVQGDLAGQQSELRTARVDRIALAKDLEREQGRLATVRADLEARKRDMQELVVEVAERKATRREAARELEERETARAELESTSLTLRQDLARLRAERSTCDEEVGELEATTEDVAREALKATTSLRAVRQRQRELTRSTAAERASLGDERRALEEAEEALAQIDANRTAQEAIRDQLRADLDQHRSAHQASSEALPRLEAEVAELQEAREAAAEARDASRAECERLEKEASEAGREQQKLTATLESVRDELVRWQEKAAGATAIRDVLREEVSDAQVTREALEEAASDAAEETSDLQRQAGECASAIERARASRREAVDRRELLEQELEDAKAARDSLAASAEEARDALSEAQAVRDERVAEVASLKASVADAEAAGAQAARELNDAAATKRDLVKASDLAVRESEASKAALDATEAEVSTLLARLDEAQRAGVHAAAAEAKTLLDGFEKNTALVEQDRVLLSEAEEEREFLQTKHARVSKQLEQTRRVLHSLEDEIQTLRDGERATRKGHEKMKAKLAEARERHKARVVRINEARVELDQTRLELAKEERREKKRRAARKAKKAESKGGRGEGDERPKADSGSRKKKKKKRKRRDSTRTERKL